MAADIGRYAVHSLPCNAVPGFCRDQSSPVMLSQELTSTGASSKLIKYNYLEMPNCLREAGVGGSNPLTPTTNSLKQSYS